MDAARDVVQIGPANPDGATQPTVIGLETPVVTDTDFGPLALPIVTTPITVQGESNTFATLDANADVRMFLVSPGALDNPDLTLKNITH